MDPITIGIIGSLATSYFANFTTPTIENFFLKAFNTKPELENELKFAKTPQDFEKVFNDAVGVIDAGASKGELDIDDAFLEAIKGIRFDHQHGTVTISKSTLKSDILVTGGSQGSTGETRITDSEMNSKGTQIKMTGGASIRMTGGASIKQS